MSKATYNKYILSRVSEPTQPLDKRQTTKKTQKGKCFSLIHLQSYQVLLMNEEHWLCLLHLINSGSFWILQPYLYTCLFISNKCTLPLSVFVKFDNCRSFHYEASSWSRQCFAFLWQFKMRGIMMRCVSSLYTAIWISWWIYSWNNKTLLCRMLNTHIFLHNFFHTNILTRKLFEPPVSECSE